MTNIGDPDDLQAEVRRLRDKHAAAAERLLRGDAADVAAAQVHATLALAAATTLAGGKT